MPSWSKRPPFAGHGDSALLAAARAGSDSKLGELLERTRRYLLLVANRSLDAELRQKQAASDLVQETFLEAQRKFNQFRGESGNELLAWLCKILENKNRDAARRFRRAAMRDVGREESIDQPARNWIDELADPATSPRALAIVREEVARLEAALGRLSAVDQEAVRLRSIQRLSFCEVGRRLGRTGDAARKLWLRAIARLESELAVGNDSS